MALALAPGMISRPRVARFTVCIGRMVKIDVVPLAGAVAVGALARPMPARRQVASPAVIKAVVVKVNSSPVFGVVASRTLVEVMIRGRRCMTRFAI